MSRIKPLTGRRTRAAWSTLFLTLLLTTLLLTPPAAAPAVAGTTVGAGVWEWQSPLPQGNRLYGVEVAPGGVV